MDLVKSDDNVLIIWGVTSDHIVLTRTVDNLKKLVGKNGKVSVENVDRLSLASYPSSTFDVVFSGTVFPHTVTHSTDLIGEIVRIVKPQGYVVLSEPVVPSITNGSNLKTIEKLQSTLKVSGLTNISEGKILTLSKEDSGKLRELLKTNEIISVSQFTAQKPNFEVGSSAKLSFAKLNTVVKPSPEVTSVWKLDATEDDDIDIINSDDLLEEEDFIKPDAASLKVCGSSGKRKACKNCTCGLAEELSTETSTQLKQNTQTSACGNCYLGDAFRCASCPYLGMPAFKPGEKIQLTDRQLKADA